MINRGLAIHLASDSSDGEPCPVCRIVREQDSAQGADRETQSND